jgi:hypothetical protein
MAIAIQAVGQIREGVGIRIALGMATTMVRLTHLWNCAMESWTCPNLTTVGLMLPKTLMVQPSAATAIQLPQCRRMYARTAPLLDEVHSMLKFGMNTFRIPFCSEYVYELWKNIWLVDNLDIPEYLPPSPNYLQMVVDLIENILAQDAPGRRGTNRCNL